MALALRAVSRRRDSIITIMALEGPVPEMMGKRHAAVRTLEGVAAIRAEDEIGKPSAIQKK
jgi:hypothetical protein